MGLKVSKQKVVLPVLFILSLLLLWELIVFFKDIPIWLIPAPSHIISAFPEMFPVLLLHSKYTVLAALTGFSLAIIVSISFSVLMTLSPIVRQGVYPLLIISQNVPIVSVAPLFIIWFGYGLLPKVVVVTLVCFFPVVVSLIQGMDSADKDMINLLKSMGATSWQVIREVQFPAALPSFFAGLKIAGTYSIMGAVIGEWLGSSKGLGIFMTRATHSYQLDKVFAAIIVIALLSLLLFGFIELLSRLAIPWHYKREDETN